MDAPRLITKNLQSHKLIIPTGLMNRADKNFWTVTHAGRFFTPYDGGKGEVSEWRTGGRFFPLMNYVGGRQSLPAVALAVAAEEGPRTAAQLPAAGGPSRRARPPQSVALRAGQYWPWRAG